MDSKRCTKCGIEKPLAEFYGHQIGRDSLHSWCSDCHKGYHAARYRTPQGRLRIMASSIMRRINKDPHYQHIDCLIGDTVDEIYKYLAPRFLADVAAIMAIGETPSIDRIDPMDGYVDGNLRIISKRENEERGGMTTKMRLGYPVYIVWPDGKRELFGSLNEAAGELGASYRTIQYLLKSGRVSKKFGCRIERVGGAT